MEATVIIGHKLDACGRLSVDRALWPEVEGRLLESLNRMEGDNQENVVDAVEMLGWEIQRNVDRPTLLLDHTNGSGRWRERHVRFLEELASMGFEGTVTAESVDEDITVEYTLSGGALSATASDHPAP